MINICARRAKTALMQCIDARKSTLFIRFSCPILYPLAQVIRQLNK